MIQLIFYSILLALVVFDAIADGVNDRTMKRNHLLELIPIALMFVLLYYNSIYPANLWRLVVGYIFIRAWAFNIAYNITRRLPVDFVGTTSYFDKLVRKVPRFFQILGLFMCWFISIVIIFNSNITL